MVRIVCLQHVLFEKPGLIRAWANTKGYPLHVIYPFKGDQFPGINEFDLLVILGGSMSVHDETQLPWLKKEKEFIRQAIREEKKILGICLGAQLLAEALGATVSENRFTEIGFFPITLTGELQNILVSSYPNKNSTVFHWHGETFNLPPGATRLAYSEACRNQAFICGNRFLGLQFHPEITKEILEDMVGQDGHELLNGKYIQRAEQILDMKNLMNLKPDPVYLLLNKFIDFQ
jgi:GMP synthase-like glutamine amidotransferase